MGIICPRAENPTNQQCLEQNVFIPPINYCQGEGRVMNLFKKLRFVCARLTEDVFLSLYEIYGLRETRFDDRQQMNSECMTKNFGNKIDPERF